MQAMGIMLLLLYTKSLCLSLGIKIVFVVFTESSQLPNMVSEVGLTR